MAKSLEQIFLDMIKPTLTKKCNNEKICSSVIAMIAIIKSSFATTREAAFARNLFNLPVDETWKGMCYSKFSGKIYNTPTDCKEMGPILYRAYINYNQSIEDYIDYIVTKRRTKNGPLKYLSIIGCNDYKLTIEKLVRAGFIQEQFRKNDDIIFIQYMINIIEKYKLYEWDSEFMENKNSNIIKNSIPSEIYRVRLNWEDPSTQIYASPIYEYALKEAMKHEGYKVFIGDNGEIFFDPWDKSEIDKPSSKPNIINIEKPVIGKEIILNKRAVYKDAISNKPDKYVSGTFYYYDSGIYRKRARITKIKGIENMKPDPILIYGYINI